MKKLLFGLVLYISCIASADAQNRNTELVGKTYRREVSAVCKSFSDGGCLITTFESITFATDSLYINHFTKASCDVPIRNRQHESKGKIGAYSYQVQKKKNSPNLIVRIDGYKLSNLEATEKGLSELNISPNTNSDKDSKLIFELYE